ncbi:MAG: DUF6311 domain-containing protein [Candidatus Krumholzibacteriia bacterium]
MGLVGALLCFWRFGWNVLNPASTQWCFGGGDTAMSQIGWRSFQGEPWGFPLGAIRNYGAPLGSSVPLVDGIPLVAIPAKLLHALVSGPWQYLGAWLLIAHVLQAVAAWYLMGRIVADRAQRFLGTLLFLLMPVFCDRWGHIALSTHGLLLVALALYAAPSSRRWSRAWVLLAVVTALVHPYLLAMVLAIAVAWLVREVIVTRALPWRRAVVTVGLIAGGALLAWWISGMFVYGLGANDAVGGYGLYSLNLNSLFNPAGHSRFLKSLPYADGAQWEGFAYLGLGLLCTWLIALCALFARGGWWARAKRHWPLLAVIIACTAFALSNRITWNDQYLSNVSVPGVIEPLSRAFRSSGRFVWLLVYAGSAFALWSLARALPRRWATAWLAVAVAVQVADISPWLDQRATLAARHHQSRLLDPAWPQAFRATSGVFTYPPFQNSTQYRADFEDIALPAVEAGKPVSAAYLARSPGARGDRIAEAWRRGVERGELDPNLLYIIRDSDFPGLFRPVGRDFRGYNLDGFRVLLKSSCPLANAAAYVNPRQGELAAFLEEHRADILVMAVRDEATTKLTAEARQLLKAMGSTIEALAYRGSYAAVSIDGRVVWDKVDNAAAVNATFAVGDHLGAAVCRRSLEIVSAGLPYGNTVSIRLNGRDEAFTCRGLNVLALSRDWQPCAIGVFDTYAGLPGEIMDITRGP